MNKDFVLELMSNGYNCSQVILIYFSKQFNIEKDMAANIAKGFESGMFKGKTCGCVSAAYIVLGLKFGNLTRELFKLKIEEFNKKFNSTIGSSICQDILGINISSNENLIKAKNDGTIPKKCPNAIFNTISILTEMIS